MELELGLKITRTRDDITSTADLWISKDPFGPVFLSRETDQMFILIAHLKGFRRENIFIEINKEGNRIAISGEKPVQEMVMMGWIMCKKDVEIKAFRKVFRIPDVVDLERIKAKYNEEESTLRIVLKKKVKGICGIRIEEDVEEPNNNIIKEELPKEEVGETSEAQEVTKLELVEKKEAEEVPKLEMVEKEAEEIPKPEMAEKKEPEEVPTQEIIEKKEAQEVPELEMIEKKEPDKVPKVEIMEKQEPEEVPKEELVRKKEPEEVAKMEIVEERVQSIEEIVEGEVEGLEEVEKESSNVERETEEPESEKEEETEEKIEKEETEAVESAIHEEPEQVEELIRQEPEEPEIETMEESGQILDTPKEEVPEEKVAAPATSPPAFVEPETMEPEVVEPQMMPSIEELQEKEPYDEIQKIPQQGEESGVEETEDITASAGQVTQKSELPSLPPSQAEDEKVANENDQAEDLNSEQSELQQSEVDVKESKMEPEPDQEPKEGETPTEQQLEDESDKEELDQKEETENMAGEIGEEADQEEHHQESIGGMDTSPEAEADKGPLEGAAMEEKERKKTKLRKPLMFAGSAFLVTLIVLVINFLRARKR